MWTPASGVHAIVDPTNKFTWTAEVLWRKGAARPPSERESAPTLAWTGFIAFWEHYIKEGSHSLCSGLL